MEDLIALWMITKKQENFKRAVIELEHWCDEVESRETEFKLEDDYFSPRDLKGYLFGRLLDKGKKPVLRGTARFLWKLVAKEFEEELKSKFAPIEFLKATHFLRLLEMWAGTGDKEFFTVTKKARSKNTRFVLAVHSDHGI